MQSVIQEIHTIYTQLNNSIFQNQLPNKVIISMAKKGGCSRKEFWTIGEENLYHIDVELKSFIHGKESFCSEILKQMIRLNCKKNKIKDTLKGKDTEEFVLECSKFGLDCETGFVNDDLQEKLSKLAYNETIFDLKALVEIKERKASPRKVIYKYHCPKCAKKIKSDIEGLQVECKECKELFEED